MPYTVNQSFEVFRQTIEPPNYDRETATTRKEHIISLLQNDFDIVNSFATGSLPRYTAIKEHSDLDIMVVLNYPKHIKDRKPSEVLQAIRRSLGNQYSNLRRNGQAVTLHYKTWPDVDVVPVCSYKDKDDLYDVPNMTDETWIKSQPNKHSTDLNVRNSSFGIEFKRIIKMIKWWNQQHGNILQSYHIEVLSLVILDGIFSDYPWNIHHFFDRAVNLLDSPLWHGINYADSYLSFTSREEIKKKLTEANSRSLDAWYRTYEGSTDHVGAIRIWRQIFGEAFPAYG